MNTRYLKEVNGRNMAGVHKKKRQSYSLSQLKDAVQACKGGMSFRKASEKYSVPVMTISDKVHGRSPLTLSNPSKPLLSTDVEELGY